MEVLGQNLRAVLKRPGEYVKINSIVMAPFAGDLAEQAAVGIG
jgi:hypothetical protein